MKTIKIVVPVDFSNYCEYALEYVTLFSSKIPCEVYLITVIEKDGLTRNISNKEIIKSEEKLIALAENWKNKIPLKDTVVRIGSIHKEIIYYAEKIINADMIFMGSHGSVISSNFFVGSNAEKIVRHFNGDVLVVKHPLVSENINKIAFTCDFKPEQTQIFPKIRDWALLFNAEIHLLYINTPSNFETTKEIEERFNHFIEIERIDKLLGDKYCTAIYCDKTLEHGILNYSLEHDIDLICMATHGKHGIERIFKESVSQQIVNHSFRPVLTLKV
jgi:nucleotide-binding universal stress UspA family protein